MVQLWLFYRNKNSSFRRWIMMLSEMENRKASKNKNTFVQEAKHLLICIIIFKYYFIIFKSLSQVPPCSAIYNIHVRTGGLLSIYPVPGIGRHWEYNVGPTDTVTDLLEFIVSWEKRANIFDIRRNYDILEELKGPIDLI